MKVWQAGNHSRAICSECQKVVTTTFNFHDVPFSDNASVVKNIIAGACDECGTVITIPAQSTPAIQAYLSKLKQPEQDISSKTVLSPRTQDKHLDE